MPKHKQRAEVSPRNSSKSNDPSQSGAVADEPQLPLNAGSSGSPLASRAEPAAAAAPAVGPRIDQPDSATTGPLSVVTLSSIPRRCRSVRQSVRRVATSLRVLPFWRRVILELAVCVVLCMSLGFMLPTIPYREVLFMICRLGPSLLSASSESAGVTDLLVRQVHVGLAEERNATAGTVLLFF
jgi:hypothetical protein